MARLLGGDQQHLHLPFPPEPRIPESARLYFGRGRSGMDQGIAHRGDTAVAKILIVRVRDAGVIRVVDREPEGRILCHVGGDVGNLTRFGGADVRSAVVEGEISIVRPMINDTDGAFRAYQSDGTLSSRRARRARRAGAPRHRGACCSRIAAGALRPAGALTAHRT